MQFLTAELSVNPENVNLVFRRITVEVMNVLYAHIFNFLTFDSFGLERFMDESFLRKQSFHLQTYCTY